MKNMELEPAIRKAIVYRLEKLEALLEVIEKMRDQGIVGRGRLIEEANTVEIKHDHWLEILRASDALKMNT